MVSNSTLGFRVALGAILFAACGEEAAPPFEDPLDGLSFEEQASAAEIEFLEIAKANASKSCPRPVLRGDPTSGKASAEIIAVAESSGNDDACAAALTDERELKLRNSYFGYGAYTADGFPPRRLGTVRPFEGDAEVREPIADLRTVCSKELEAIGKAVAHVDACSPYLPGVRKFEDFKKKYLHLTTLVATSAVERARAGETQRAMESLLDMIRFGQDFHRGGTSMLESSIATAGTSRIVPAVESILNRSEPLGTVFLEQVDRELASLIATEPHPSEFLGGETTNRAVYLLLPRVSGRRWSPPGVFIGASDETSAFTPQEAYIGLMATHKTRLAFALSCKEKNTAAACVSDMGEMSDRVVSMYWGNRNASTRYLEELRAALGEPSAEETIMTLLAVAPAAYSNYVKKIGQTRFYLGALRLLAKYRALTEKTLSCPGLSAFDSPAFAEARIDPYSGKKMRVTELGKGRFAVRSSEVLEFGGAPEDAIAVHVRCSLN